VTAKLTESYARLGSEVVDTASFLDDLNDMLNTAAKADGMLGLVLVKLLHVGRLSSTLGLLTSEEVLQLCTTQISDGLGGRAAVFRIANDKLAVVVFNIRNEGHATLAAQKIQRILKHPVAAAGEQIRVSCAQGLSLFPAHSRDVVELIRYAEVALETARRAGEDICVHSVNKRPEQSSEWGLEQQIELALSEGHLAVEFQPRLDLRTHKVQGAEGLLRCQESDMSPEKFIAVAEEMGRVFDVTSVLLNAALRHAYEWCELGSPVGVAVQVPPSVISNRECIYLVGDALKIWNVPNGTLTLEIAENAFQEDPKGCFRTLEALRTMGVRTCIDAFGTGYSSLSQLKEIPVEELKIDRSFVTSMLRDAADARITAAVIELAHAFGLQVIADGVEDQATLEELKKMDCDFAQGCHLTPPLAPREFLSWQRRWESDQAADSGDQGNSDLVAV
jgi:predicted signal transduction protein with EAL and GGDEF domain